MKRLIQILKYTTIGLLFVSIVFIVYSITRIVTSCQIGLIDRLYNTLVKYSGLYQFTLVVGAFWVTLRQLGISQSNLKNTLNQIQFAQKNIEEKRNKDITSETLKQCNVYLEEIQIAYKELIETNVLSGMALDWHLLVKPNSDSLKKHYPTAYEKFQQIDRSVKNQVLITLYKLEAFSILVIYGNLDKKLALEIFGYTFIKQTGFLIGLISYFRQENEHEFGQRTLRLYSEWKNEINK